MPIMYYGSKISENMTKTPEGYLICRNVPIGRTGAMTYYGEELNLEEKRGIKLKVTRKPEELFSKATIASFEGKPVTNDHPSNNLTIDTINIYSRGHTENVRSEGDLLMADLYVVDAGLISEIENGKREVSCGYDCLWIENEDGTYEQKEIVGNHVAIVQEGRAGPRVAIKDSKIQDGGRKKMKEKVNKSFLAALGFKHFAKDAEPEEIKDAMDALNEESEVPAKEETKDEDPMQQILEAVKALSNRISALEKSDKQVHTELGADEEFTGLENEMNDAAHEEPDGDEPASEVVDSEPDGDEGEKEETKDSAPFAKMVKDMKPIIMAIPDEKARNAAAKAFAKSVRDAMGKSTSFNPYGKILSASNDVRKKVADANANANTSTFENNAKKATDNWNKLNAHYKGGEK